MTGQNAADVALGILGSLRDCLDVEFTARGVPPCSVSIVPGATVVPDKCGCGTYGCGQAWVRLDRMFPSRRFPSQDTDGVLCATAIAGVIEVGVIRCVPTFRGGGQPPTDLDVTGATIAALTDASAVLAALHCCPEVQARPHLLGTYTPLSWGDCGGGMWPVTVQLRRTE